MPNRSRAARALIRALSSNVSPVSSGLGHSAPSSSAETNCQPGKSSVERISASLPRLLVATTTRVSRRRRQDSKTSQVLLDDLPLDLDESVDSAVREIEHARRGARGRTVSSRRYPGPR